MISVMKSSEMPQMSDKKSTLVSIQITQGSYPLSNGMRLLRVYQSRYNNELPIQIGWGYVPAERQVKYSDERK